MNYASYLDENEYIIADSAIRVLTETDLEGLTNDELRIARNEILARYGRKFSSKDLQDYLNSKSWYNGTIEPGNIRDSEYLNSIEFKNFYFISDYEKGR